MADPQGSDVATASASSGPSPQAYVGLGVGAVALGVATAVGVWLFNQAFELVHRITFDGIADALVARVSSEGELERARAILARKYREPAKTREDKARRARFLQGRGFSFDVVQRLLRTED